MDSEESIFIEGAIKNKDVAEYLETRAQSALDKFLNKKQEPSETKFGQDQTLTVIPL